MARRADDDDDVTEYGNDGHLDWCYECGREAAIDGEPRDSCSFKNWDQCNVWHDGYAEGLNWLLANATLTQARGEESMATKLERYLGDGVYASFDGYHIWLDCRGQSGFGTNPGGYLAIALEPQVMRSLQQFQEEVYADAREESAPPHRAES